MNKVISALFLGLSLASVCASAAVQPTKKHPAPAEYVSYSTATVTTGVDVTTTEDLCTISATWANMGQIVLALPALHTFQLRGGCDVLAQANLVERADNGWQPTLYAWYLYRTGPSAYADVLKKAVTTSSAGL